MILHIHTWLIFFGFQRHDGLYVKNRVAMDFSGNRGHVVDDPNEALCVAIEEGHHWRVGTAVSVFNYISWCGL